MRFFSVAHGVVAFVNRVLVLSLATALVLYYLFPALFAGVSLRAFVDSERSAGLWIAAALAAANLVPLLDVAFRHRGHGGYIVSRSSAGPARVSLQALRRSLQSVADSVPGVRRARLMVQRLSPRHYRIGARYWIRDNENAIVVGERLRLVLQRRLAELVSLDERHRIDIEVSLAGLLASEAGAVPPARPAEETPKAFQGPVYPVDGDTLGEGTENT
ncbi:MAG: hypothetical protein AB1486_22780 [Planctomycetota bacterium]